jgi:hypothetical protein
MNLLQPGAPSGGRQPIGKQQQQQKGPKPQPVCFISILYSCLFICFFEEFIKQLIQFNSI